MSFLRHGEIYPCDEGAILRPCPPLIAVDESPAGYSWQVALQQSPLPLYQPELYCQSSTAPDNASAGNGAMSLNGLSQPRGPVQVKDFPQSD
jgi:hypothetical protein